MSENHPTGIETTNHFSYEGESHPEIEGFAVCRYVNVEPLCSISSSGYIDNTDDKVKEWLVVSGKNTVTWTRWFGVNCIVDTEETQKIAESVLKEQSGCEIVRYSICPEDKR